MTVDPAAGVVACASRDGKPLRQSAAEIQCTDSACVNMVRIPDRDTGGPNLANADTVTILIYGGNVPSMVGAELALAG